VSTISGEVPALGAVTTAVSCLNTWMVRLGCGQWLCLCAVGPGGVRRGQAPTGELSHQRPLIGAERPKIEHPTVSGCRQGPEQTRLTLAGRAGKHPAPRRRRPTDPGLISGTCRSPRRRRAASRPARGGTRLGRQFVGQGRVQDGHDLQPADLARADVKVHGQEIADHVLGLIQPPGLGVGRILQAVAVTSTAHRPWLRCVVTLKEPTYTGVRDLSHQQPGSSCQSVHQFASL
jgi:hypothetical protein